MLKVGDIVRIRSLEEIENDEYHYDGSYSVDGVYLLHSMLSSSLFKISEIEENIYDEKNRSPIYFLKTDDTAAGNGHRSCMYTEGMLELVETEEKYVPAIDVAFEDLWGGMI